MLSVKSINNVILGAASVTHAVRKRLSLICDESESSKKGEDFKSAIIRWLYLKFKLYTISPNAQLFPLTAVVCESCQIAKRVHKFKLPIRHHCLLSQRCTVALRLTPSLYSLVQINHRPAFISIIRIKRKASKHSECLVESNEMSTQT